MADDFTNVELDTIPDDHNIDNDNNNNKNNIDPKNNNINNNINNNNNNSKVDMDDDCGRPSEESMSMPYTSNESDMDQEVLLLKRALLVCVVAFIITITSAIVGIAIGIINRSSAFLAFGCDAFVDIFAGSFIVWRFSGRTSTAEQVNIIEKRENRASIGIAFALVLIAIIASFQAISHLVDENPPQNDSTLFIVSGVLGVILLIVSLFKFWIAHKLKSLALKESGVTNISGFFLAIGVLIANGAYLANPSVWFLDASFAIIISMIMAGFGVYTMIVKRNMFWWRKAFWLPSPDLPKIK